MLADKNLGPYTSRETCCSINRRRGDKIRAYCDSGPAVCRTARLHIAECLFADLRLIQGHSAYECDASKRESTALSVDD